VLPLRAPTNGADTPTRSPIYASPLKRTHSYDSTASEEHPVSSSEWRTQPQIPQPQIPQPQIPQPQIPQPPQRPDHLPSNAFNQRQKDLVAACWNLDRHAVYGVLSQSNGAQVYLNGLSDYYGNSPLQVAVDALIHHVDSLRATKPGDWRAREHAREGFYWVMIQLIERMEMPELQNINSQGYHALRKLAHWAADWRLLSPLIEAMERTSGDYPTTFEYRHGAKSDKDDTHVIGSLVEYFQVRDVGANGVIETQTHPWCHQVGRFYL
jgi:hypothetical protein